MGAFIDNFMKEYESSGIPAAEMLRLSFRQLGAFIHLALFHAWSDEICNNEMPLIELSTSCLVGRYVLPVVYYVASWTLYSVSKALTIANVKRPLYFMFAALHTFDEQSAKAMNLPKSLVERRKRRVSVYCIGEYFEFICLVESIYIANLTLKMMLAYNKGNIVTVIKTSILGSKDDDDNTLLLMYIIERYSHSGEHSFC
jgi:hypothetical protein